MKRLLLFRHAKADRGPRYATDHTRDLTKRGARAAGQMGRFLTEAATVPDVAVTSSAVRARRTLDLAIEAGQWKCPVRVADTLYEAAVDDVVAEIRTEPDTTNTLMLVGHEPTWSETAAALIGGGSIRLATGSVVALEFPIDDWHLVEQATGSIVWMVVPGLLT